MPRIRRRNGAAQQIVSIDVAIRFALLSLPRWVRRSVDCGRYGGGWWGGRTAAPSPDCVKTPAGAYEKGMLRGAICPHQAFCRRPEPYSNHAASRESRRLRHRDKPREGGRRVCRGAGPRQARVRKHRANASVGRGHEAIEGERDAIDELRHLCCASGPQAGVPFSGRQKCVFWPPAGMSTKELRAPARGIRRPSNTPDNPVPRSPF